MDILNSWSLKIAKEVTPDKIDLAPIMTQAFVKGGKAREDLFYQEKKGAWGGFGAQVIYHSFWKHITKNQVVTKQDRPTNNMVSMQL